MELNSKAPTDFSEFFSHFNDQLDKACKLNQPKSSKRTAKNNPWITQGLITSIDRKYELYDKWKKSEKLKCLSPPAPNFTQDRCDSCCNCINRVTSRSEFTAHRRLLNHLINCAKRKYHGVKIAECSGDSRKTWQVINELRGKKRRDIKPNFVIDNERDVPAIRHARFRVSGAF